MVNGGKAVSIHYSPFTIHQNLAVAARLGQVVVDHAAAVFARFGGGGVAALFGAADLVLRVETFEYELAGGDEHRLVCAREVEGGERVVYQLGHGFEQAHALVGGGVFGE